MSMSADANLFWGFHIENDEEDVFRSKIQKKMGWEDDEDENFSDILECVVSVFNKRSKQKIKIGYAGYCGGGDGLSSVYFYVGDIINACWDVEIVPPLKVTSEMRVVAREFLEFIGLDDERHHLNWHIAASYG